MGIVLTLFICCAFSQDAVAENDTDQTITQESDFVIAATNDTDNQSMIEDQGEQENIIWLFVRMILALVFVVALIYGIVLFLKKGFVPKESENPFLKRAATLTLAPGKTVQVITMPDKAWVVGVTDAGINLIGEITDADLVNQMILEAEKEPLSKPRDFASILNSFTHTAKNTESILKEQRLRLRRGGHNE